MYLKQKYAQAYWKVGQLEDMHSGHNSNVHTWIMYGAFGGRTPKTASRSRVSQIFIQDECDRVTFRRLPITWQRAFRRAARRLRTGE